MFLEEATMNRRDWTLLAIAAADGEPLSPVQLQKALFLLGQMMPRQLDGGGFYDFRPYSYGPFDATVYQDAESLSAEGLVHIEVGRWKQYAATSKGLGAADEVRRDANPDAVQYLSKVVAWVRSISFRELIKAIYARFPEYREKSVFRY